MNDKTDPGAVDALDTDKPAPVSPSTHRALEAWRAMSPSEQLGRLAAPGNPYEEAPAGRMIDVELQRLIDTVITKTVEAQLYTENEAAGIPTGLFTVRTSYQIAHTGMRLLDVVTHSLDPKGMRTSRMQPVRYYEQATTEANPHPMVPPALKMSQPCAWEVMDGDTQAGKVCITGCGVIVPVEMAGGVLHLADENGQPGDVHRLTVNYCPNCGAPVGGTAKDNAMNIFRPDVMDDQP